jgi:hypothetical protein
MPQLVPVPVIGKTGVNLNVPDPSYSTSIFPYVEQSFIVKVDEAQY